MLYVIAHKTKTGSVQLFLPDVDISKPARYWLTINKGHSHFIDYRNKYITLNCYKYLVMWDKD